MANDIDKTSPHYKGDFDSIYEVNKKFPTGGVAGDFVVIEGWAHYWNADRGTWCVNAERDSYWDELITNIIEKFKLVRGATYMGVASLNTVPTKVIGAKMYYFATIAGTYKNFDNLVVPQGINVLYSENGSSWVNTTLLEVAQELGLSTNKVVSQKTLNDALTKKFDKESVVQESGEAEDKVMSQKAVSDKLSDLSSSTDSKSDTYLLGTHPELFGKYTMIGSNNSILVLNQDPHLTWSCRTSSTFIDLSALGFSPKTITIYSPSDLSTSVMNVVFLQNKDIIKGNINVSDAGLIQSCSNENFNNYYDKGTNTFTITSDNVDMAKYKYLLYSFLLTDRTYIVIDGDSTHRAIFGIENEKLNNIEQKIDNEISALNRKTASLDEQQRFSETCLSQFYVTEADFNGYTPINGGNLTESGKGLLKNNGTYLYTGDNDFFMPRCYKFKDKSPLDAIGSNRYTSFLVKADPSGLNSEDLVNARVCDNEGVLVWQAKLSKGYWQISIPYGYEIEIFGNIAQNAKDAPRYKTGFFHESEKGDELSKRLSLIENSSLFTKLIRAASPTDSVSIISGNLTYLGKAALCFIDLSKLSFTPTKIVFNDVPEFVKGYVVLALCKNDNLKRQSTLANENFGLLVDIYNSEMNSLYDASKKSITVKSTDVDFSTYKWIVASISFSYPSTIDIYGDNEAYVSYGLTNTAIQEMKSQLNDTSSCVNALSARQQFVDHCLRQIYITDADFKSYEKIVDKLEIHHLGIPNLSNMGYTYEVEEPWEGFKPRTYKFKDTNPNGNRYTSFLIHGDPSGLNGDFCNARVWDANGNFIWNAKLAEGTWEISLPLGYEIEIYQNIGKIESFWVRMKQGFFDESERGNVENNLNPWAGKCIAFYGDSVTYIGQGTGTSNGHASAPYVADWGNNWQLYIAKYLGLKEFYSRGVGSAMYEYQNWVQYAHTETGYSGERPYPFVNFDEAEEKEGFTKTHGYLAAWDRIKAQFPPTIKDTIDAVFITDANSAFSNHISDDFETPAFIEGATKDADWAADNTYNVFGGDYDITTFAGAICSMIMKLQAWMPNAQIIIGSQISGMGDDSISGAVKGENFTKLDKARKGMYCAEKTRKIAGMMSIPYIPVWETMSINPLNRKGKISDIVHPYTRAGGYRVGKTIAQYLMNFTPSEPPV